MYRVCLHGPLLTLQNLVFFICEIECLCNISFPRFLKHEKHMPHECVAQSRLQQAVTSRIPSLDYASSSYMKSFLLDQNSLGLRVFPLESENNAWLFRHWLKQRFLKAKSLLLELFEKKKKGGVLPPQRKYIVSEFKNIIGNSSLFSVNMLNPSIKANNSLVKQSILKGWKGPTP